MARSCVGLLGASGETGRSILEGLLEDGNFDIIVLARPASLSKPANVAFKDKGVQLRAVDLGASEDSIVSALQVPLATAAKKAGVQRFVPCGFAPAMPVGVHMSRDQKEVVYNHVKRLHLPYTIIDVGWWYQFSFPKLPSGKIDYVVGLPGQRIPGDGNVPSALTDLRDIGRYVAQVIRDERTLNAMVFVHNEMWTSDQIHDLLEQLSGETIPREYASAEEYERQIVEADTKLKDNPEELASSTIQKVASQYYLSWGIRGENTPEYARYLGYLDGKKLYPDVKFTSFESYLQEVVSGKAKGVYQDSRPLFEKANKKAH
ncbi:isoflavone reductase family protein [Polychaeton citri CBS 116435]|uniref:Isoflavone reductase family protein n=1 Tax=Polychaeton citri CBS 116435 TaxID=1314669 RepID=A0A9P4Q4P1_9PEZI|nr:isoflavone reductase family protein [Polychaeton citri CBS 116435]